MNIYENPKLYDAIHKDYKLDNKLIKSIVSKNGGPVLELASGTGRLAKIILKLVYRYGLNPSFSVACVTLAGLSQLLNLYFCFKMMFYPWYKFQKLNISKKFFF